MNNQTKIIVAKELVERFIVLDILIQTNLGVGHHQTEDGHIAINDKGSDAVRDYNFKLFDHVGYNQSESIYSLVDSIKDFIDTVSHFVIIGGKMKAKLLSGGKLRPISDFISVDDEAIANLVDYLSPVRQKRVVIGYGVGKAIVDMYNATTSCLRYNEKGELDTYIDNPDTIGCLTYAEKCYGYIIPKSKTNVWRDMAGDVLIDKTYGPLKVYHACLFAIANNQPLWAMDFGHTNEYSSIKYREYPYVPIWIDDIVRGGGTYCFKHHMVKLDICGSHAYPYFDTLRYEYDLDVVSDDEATLYMHVQGDNKGYIVRQDQKFPSILHHNPVAYDVSSMEELSEEDMEDRYVYIDPYYYNEHNGLQPACHVDEAVCCDINGEVYHRDDVVWITSRESYVLYNDDVVDTYDYEHTLRDYAVELHDGEYADDEDPSIVELWDGSYAIDGRDDVIVFDSGMYDGECALIDDDAVVEVDGLYYHMDDIVKTDDDEYAPLDDVVTTFDGGVYRYADCVQTVSGRYAHSTIHDDRLRYVEDIEEWYIVDDMKEKQEIEMRLGQERLMEVV